MTHRPPRVHRRSARASLSFYADVFGWKRNDALSIGDYAVAEIGDGPLTIGIGPVPKWSTRGAKFYVQVDDIDETLQRVESSGGKRVMLRTIGRDFGAKHILVFTSFLDPPATRSDSSSGQRASRTRRATGTACPYRQVSMLIDARRPLVEPGPRSGSGERCGVLGIGASRPDAHYRADRRAHR